MNYYDTKDVVVSLKRLYFSRTLKILSGSFIEAINKAIKNNTKSKGWIVKRSLTNDFYKEDFLLNNLSFTHNQK